MNLLQDHRTSNMIVCKDFWMSRTSTLAYKLCTGCPMQPSINASYVVSCTKHNKWSANLLWLCQPAVKLQPVVKWQVVVKYHYQAVVKWKAMYIEILQCYSKVTHCLNWYIFSSWINGTLTLSYLFLTVHFCANLSEHNCNLADTDTGRWYTSKSAGLDWCKYGSAETWLISEGN